MFKINIRLAKIILSTFMIILEKENQAANFFVERVYRADWNTTNQFINCIIEVILK
jgi:hypothetical protein